MSLVCLDFREGEKIAFIIIISTFTQKIKMSYLRQIVLFFKCFLRWFEHKNPTMCIKYAYNIFLIKIGTDLKHNYFSSM